MCLSDQSMRNCLILKDPLVSMWRKSVTSFFAAYDALCEEGTATTVCEALSEVADISVPGKFNIVLNII